MMPDLRSCQFSVSRSVQTFQESKTAFVDYSLFCDRRFYTQLAAVSQQVKMEQALFRDPFLSLLCAKSSVVPE